MGGIGGPLTATVFKPLVPATKSESEGAGPGMAAGSPQLYPVFRLPDLPLVFPNIAIILSYFGKGRLKSGISNIPKAGRESTNPVIL